MYPSSPSGKRGHEEMEQLPTSPRRRVHEKIGAIVAMLQANEEPTIDWDATDSEPFNSADQFSNQYEELKAKHAERTTKAKRSQARAVAQRRELTKLRRMAGHNKEARCKMYKENGAKQHRRRISPRRRRTSSRRRRNRRRDVCRQATRGDVDAPDPPRQSYGLSEKKLLF